MRVITVARKPLVGTVAKNALDWSAGGLNIDESRVGSELMSVTQSDGTFKSTNRAMAAPNTGRIQCGEKEGRWPTNVILSCDPEGLELPETRNGGQNETSMKGAGMFMDGAFERGTSNFAGDSGSACRFFKRVDIPPSDSE